MPVARPSCRPGFPGVPGVSPRKDFRLAMNEFVLPPGEVPQGFLASNFKIFLVIREIHKKARVIPRERELSTALSTSWSTGCAPDRLRGQEPERRRSWCGRRASQRPGAGPEGGEDMGGNALRRSEAPPRMRWRGLPAAIQQGADYSATGVLSGRSTGAGKSARSASFPALRTPTRAFRFPGPPTCGGSR